jgi:hypothetical protein
MKSLTGIYWIKNEARYLPEFIEFHLLQGFDHFIFYDNKSDDNLLEVISPYIEAGLVEIRYYPEDLNTSKNFWIMKHCTIEQRGKTKWLHYHASDERLFCPDGRNLVDLLKDYEDYGGLCVGWSFFNSNGHVKRPDGLIIDNFTNSFNDGGKHIKTIIQPDKALEAAGNPHNFVYIEGQFSVDENFKRVDGPWNTMNDYTFNKVKLHHYVTMSKEEYDIKQGKGILDHNQEDVRRGGADVMWDAYHAQPELHFKDDVLSIKYSTIVKQNILERYKNKEYILPYINH